MFLVRLHIIFRKTTKKGTHKKSKIDKEDLKERIRDQLEQVQLIILKTKWVMTLSHKYTLHVLYPTYCVIKL